MKVTKTSISLALTAALGASGAALADSNPFAMQSLEQGYMLAQSDKAGEGKCGEGKCGNTAKPKQSSEGKCGDQPKPKQAKEGQCGGQKEKTNEGKCGGQK